MNDDNKDQEVAMIDDDEARGVVVKDQEGIGSVFAEDMQLLDPEDQDKHLIKYWDNREYFRKWLLSKFEQGIHYGFPPGCEVKYNDKGEVVVKNKQGNWNVQNSKQWQAKPSLYKAGAAFLKDLLRLRDEYESDAVAQTALQGQGTFIRVCRLFDKATNKFVGQGSGAYKVGNKNMDANAALKMADKNALTAAVLNTTAISDLFTQDIEDKETTVTTEPTGSDENSKKLLQDWSRVVFEKSHPLHGHTPSAGELSALRAMIKVWMVSFEELKGGSEAVVKWLKENCAMSELTDKEGNPIGIQVQLKRENWNHE